MKKLLLAAFLLASAQLIAQSRQGTVEYDRTLVPAYIIDVPFSPSVAEDAIKERFKKMGLSSNNRRGFLEYRNVVIPEISANPIDAYIKVEKKSRRERDASVVYMIVNPVGSTSSTTTAGTVASFSAGADVFLSSLTANTGDYNLELEIKKQDDEVKKAEKRYNNLVDDGNDMQKKLRKLQDDIVDNTKKQQEQTGEVQKQRDILTQMMNRRRKL